jgi:hypothetical protein
VSAADLIRVDMRAASLEEIFLDYYDGWCRDHHDAQPPAGRLRGGRGGPAVTALAARQVRRGALVVALLSAGVSALVLARRWRRSPLASKLGSLGRQGLNGQTNPSHKVIPIYPRLPPLAQDSTWLFLTHL